MREEDADARVGGQSTGRALNASGSAILAESIQAFALGFAKHEPKAVGDYHDDNPLPRLILFPHEPRAQAIEHPIY